MKANENREAQFYPLVDALKSVHLARFDKARASCVLPAFALGAENWEFYPLFFNFDRYNTDFLKNNTDFLKKNVKKYCKINRRWIIS